jgi:molybdopterin converting factor small subunit
MKALTVTIKLFGTLRQYVPRYDHQRGVQLSLNEGATIQDLLTSAGLPESEARFFLIRGLSKKMDDPLQDKDEVCIFMQMAGG